ncbi:MAG TPA: DNA polymerase III subunit delta', partial [Actinomycetota bacterium]|nr:DNA polymerase III subunit delta' [Actinomycetota bacterium]
MSAVLERVPGQQGAIAFLVRAAADPHHAYLFAGPEGSGKQLAARAFVAALLCPDGGCGECRACRLALAERHPNVAVVEPEGRDIRVDTIRDEVWTPAYRTAPEPGRKVFVVREADRLNEAAADVLLKVLEEPPPETVLLLLSARPEELPETIRSRCHQVTFHPLSERFVVDALVAEGIPEERALLACRLAGGNLGRARRLAADPEGLAFRDEALQAVDAARAGGAGALAAAEALLAGTATYRKRLKEELAGEMQPVLDPVTGKVDDAYRAVARRIEERYHRRDRRAEREYLDWSLLALEAWFRDALAAASGTPAPELINLDRAPAVAELAGALEPAEAARAVGAMEDARAAL